MSERFVVLSGCSGGGKSTLLDELCRRGHPTFDEPGRRIVQEETAKGGTALPWVDLEAFARRAIEVALNDREEARDRTGWFFFDRGVVDAVTALDHTRSNPQPRGWASHIATIRLSFSPRCGPESTILTPNESLSGRRLSLSMGG